MKTTEEKHCGLVLIIRYRMSLFYRNKNKKEDRIFTSAETPIQRDNAKKFSTNMSKARLNVTTNTKNHRTSL